MSPTDRHFTYIVGNFARNYAEMTHDEIKLYLDTVVERLESPFPDYGYAINSPRVLRAQQKVDDLLRHIKDFRAAATRLGSYTNKRLQHYPYVMKLFGHPAHMNYAYFIAAGYKNPPK